MNTIKVLKGFFYFEVGSLIFIIIFILLQRLFSLFKTSINQKRKKRISQVIANCYQNKKECHLIFKIHSDLILLEVLEEYNLRFSGGDWDQLKTGLVSKLLLPKARKWVRSIFWVRRNFSARVFALVPIQDNEELILKLIHDPIFLVSSIATVAIVKLESEKGVKEVLSLMSKKKGYSYYFYADTLSQGSNKIFQILSKIAETDPSNQLMSLEVLALQTAQVPLNFLLNMLTTDDEQLKVTAYKVAIRNSKKEYEEVFCSSIKDKNETIRILSAKGLASFQDQKSCQALKSAQDDESWQVRLAAAKSLKELNKVNLIIDPELKNYVINFD